MDDGLNVYAVESDKGWFSALARDEWDLLTWMFQWFRIYDSSGNLLRKQGVMFRRKERSLK